jgi:hypothetical protein
MRMWEEFISIAETIIFSGDEDELIWQFYSSGVYSSQSMYDVLNYRGATPIFTSAMWHLRVPPRVHFFLWLVSKNRLLTRDNLEKRRNMEDLSCLFCAEKESTHHLLFDCMIAQQAWSILAKVFNV